MDDSLSLAKEHYAKLGLCSSLDLVPKGDPDFFSDGQLSQQGDDTSSISFHSEKQEEPSPEYPKAPTVDETQEDFSLWDFHPEEPQPPST
jgi:hypothetical protein